MSSLDLSGISDDLIRRVSDDLDLYTRWRESIQNGPEVPPRDGQSATGEQNGKTNGEKLSAPQLRSLVAAFATTHEEAERSVAALILKHIGVSLSVLRPPHPSRLLVSGGVGGDGDGIDGAASTTAVGYQPIIDDVIPKLSPVPWLTEGSWDAMSEEERARFMEHVVYAFRKYSGDIDRGDGDRYYPEGGIFRRSFVLFGRGIDRVVLGHGPRRVLVIVGIHGNEYCGVEAVKIMLQRHRLFTGWEGASATVDSLGDEAGWTTPLEDLFDVLTMEFIVGNPRAVERDERFVKKNLNRMLDVHLLCNDNAARDGGYEMELQRGRILMESIRHSDFVLDIHSCSSDSEPFALPSSMDVSEEFAVSLPVSYVVESLANGVGGGTTMDAALLHGIPGVCVECGRHRHPDVVARAVSVVSAFLRAQYDDESGFVPRTTPMSEASGNAPIVMRCDTIEVVQEGFQYLGDFKEFEYIHYGTPVFKDKARGEVCCPVDPGAYLVMPTKLPVIGEEALFWARSVTVDT